MYFRSREKSKKLRHRLSIACGAFQSLPRGGRWAGRKPGSDEGYLSQRIGCVLRQHRTTWNHPRDPSGEARHHEGQGAFPGSALVHYGSLSAGSPHPSASRPPSPSGKAFYVVASTFIISYYPARVSIIRTATGTDSRQSTTPPSRAKGALTPSAEWNGKPRLLSTAIRIAAAT